VQAPFAYNVLLLFQFVNVVVLVTLLFLAFVNNAPLIANLVTLVEQEIAMIQNASMAILSIMVQTSVLSALMLAQFAM
jgi:hypothetical protein